MVTSEVVERLTAALDRSVVEGLSIPPYPGRHVRRGVVSVTAALALRRGAAGLAGLALQHLAAAGPARPGADPRDRDLPCLLRDPRAAVGDPGPGAADERPRRPLPVLPQPALPRGLPPGGAWLGAPAGL